MNNQGRVAMCGLWFALLLTACQTSRRPAPGMATHERAGKVSWVREFAPAHETMQRIMALDAGHVTEKDIREALAGAPAPRIINIHGGLLPLQGSMTSFSEFLVGMGYPRVSIQNPRDGSCAFGYYVSSEKISGAIAWYYEHEGLRPMMVGHSQGGLQVVKVLYKLAGHSTETIPLWNPLTWKAEERYDFIDPLTGKTRALVGLRIPYATAVVAGGLSRALPNQWQMNGKLRRIPDSVEEFTGFQKGLDMLGGDFFGYGSSNEYKPLGTASVRNVRLPSSYAHTTIPFTRHLLKSQSIKDWINNYQPGCESVETPELDVQFDSDCSHILWAADVWYSIKKHWVLELQRLLRAKHADHHDP
jgi:hypothetical protein